jgi:probable HAF family extracellular repeat protein
MRQRRFALVLAVATVIAMWSLERTTHTQSNPSYGVIDLGTIGGSTTVALTLDEGGLPYAYGYGTTSAGQVHAFRTIPGFSTTDLGTLGGQRSEARRSHQYSAVGLSELADGTAHAVSFESSVPKDLGTLGGTQSYANGVRRLQQLGGAVVVGGSTLPGDATTHAFIYQNDGMSDLGATLGGPNNLANDINAAGHIVGFADLPGGAVHHAFLWNGGATTDLGSLGANSEALAINDSDVIVGRSQFASGAQHAFRYIGGVMHDLGTLGGVSSEAADVNTSGAIVGWAETAGGLRHAFIWRDGLMTDLNTQIRSDTGWELQAATGIADLNGIVGYGTFQGQTRAFMLTPAKDLTLTLAALDTFYDTNYPRAVEAGQSIVFGATVFNPGAYTLTGITVTHTFTGPVELDPARTSGVQSCSANGLQLTCRLAPIDAARGYRGMVVFVRTTAAGIITHSATMTADTPDTNSSNNSTAIETNIAVSLASFTLASPTVIGGELSLGHVALTSSAPLGEAVVTLTSSHPQIASVPSQFEVLGYCCDNGTWREFYVTTKPVSTTTTVEITATYGLVTRVVPLTIAPAGVATPYSGAATPLPGLLQAEDFDVGGEGVSYHDTDRGNEGGAYRQTDVDIENTIDVGGGADVGWISPGEWLAYTVNVAMTGLYTMDARVAASGAGGTFHVEVDGANATGSLTIPDTGGWQAWTTVSSLVTLPAGIHIVRLSFDTVGPGGAIGNINFLRFSPSDRPVSTPFRGVAWTIPGTVQAEDFDNGGEGMAYHDAGAGNDGGQYRSSDVDIEATRDAGGGYNVGWISPGEFLAYTVNIARGGTFELEARVAAAGAGGSFHVDVDGANATGSLTIPDTGGWQAWTTVSTTITLPAGIHILRVSFDAAGPNGIIGNLNYLRFRTSDGRVSTPFGGTPRAIPGTIQAEDFDDGEEGVAYHESTAGNYGGWYRTTDVDIEATDDVGGGYNVGWIAAGEFLGYTVNVAASGSYKLEARVASLGGGGRFHVETGQYSYQVPTFSMPDTGGWQNWTTVSAPVNLTAGVTVIRVVFDAAGPGGDVGNLNWLRFTPSLPHSGTPVAVPGIVYAANFDLGGEGVAYRDTTPGDSGGLGPVNENVDVERTSDTSGGACCNVGWMTAGEWLNYTVAVAEAGTYTVRARVASAGAGGEFHVEFGGRAATYTQWIPNTGGWQVWTDVYLTVTLDAGTQVMRFYADANGPSGVFGNLNYLELTED